MNVTKKVTSVYCQVYDPADETRQFAWHVDYVEITTYEDGSRKVGQPMQCNMARAKELGLDLPDVFDEVHVEVARERDELAQKLQEAESNLDAAKEQVEGLRASIPEIVKVAAQKGIEAGAAAVQARMDAALAEEETLKATPEVEPAEEIPFWKRVLSFFS